VDWIFGFFMFAIVVFIAAGILTFVAKRQADFRVVGGSARDLMALLEHSGALNSGWKRTQGKGGVNIKLGFLRGGRDNRPVLSIDVNDVPEGAHVTVWMSEWKTALRSIMEPVPAIAVILRRKRIVKLLDSITDPIQPSGQATPGFPAQPASAHNPAPAAYSNPTDGYAGGSQSYGNPPQQQGFPTQSARQHAPQQPTWGPGSGYGQR
jgi:hypothetical protein